MQTRHLVDPGAYQKMTTDELRRTFLLEDLFVPDEVRLVHWDGERTILGSAVPARQSLRLEPPAEIKAPFFLARRELGIVNVGGQGTVTADGRRHALGPRDILYLGMGVRDVAFESERAESPARFYLVSHPAHASHATARVPAEEVAGLSLGATANASERTLRRYVHAAGPTSCQLVMGVTDIHPGSVWNTLPPHTHVRRTEVYLYFDLAPDATVFHFMGLPDQTRHLVVRNLQAVMSPAWSVHFGVGTTRYAFVWSMGGENQEFEDMQTVTLDRLR
jgi:4-deoxy-L-threo-5-hexosulose-uronate ketol-isomerase